MKNLIILTIIAIMTSCGSDTIGIYKKEPLTEDVIYKVIKDEGNSTVDKNELFIELNKKITIGQIATIADELYSSKDKRGRFYMFYTLEGMPENYVWAISHFDPDLKIEIVGSNEIQEKELKSDNVKIDGNVIGKWFEEEYTSSSYIIFEKDNKIFIKTTSKDGQSWDDELVKKSIDGKIRFDYKEGGTNGEYFILNSTGSLEFYNKENKNFTTATKVE